MNHTYFHGRIWGDEVSVAVTAMVWNIKNFYNQSTLELQRVFHTSDKAEVVLTCNSWGKSGQSSGTRKYVYK